MLSFQELEIGKLYTVVAGNYDHKDVVFLCNYAVKYGCIMYTSDSRCQRCAKSDNAKYPFKIAFTGDDMRFEEHMLVKDKRWISKQLISMI